MKSGIMETSESTSICVSSVSFPHKTSVKRMVLLVILCGTCRVLTSHESTGLHGMLWGELYFTLLVELDKSSRIFIARSFNHIMTYCVFLNSNKFIENVFQDR
jgi:hypothetical protein